MLPRKSLASFVTLLAALAALAGCGSPSRTPAVGQDELTRDVYQRDCDSGIGSACYELGVSYVDGRWGPVDEACGFALLERACADSYAGACARVGEMKAEGRGTPQDVAGAAALLHRACDEGSARACQSLATLDRTPEEIHRKIKRSEGS